MQIGLLSLPYSLALTTRGIQGVINLLSELGGNTYKYQTYTL